MYKIFLYNSYFSVYSISMAGKVDTAQYIFDTLKDEILSLELKPSDEISEADLCKRFDASRTPVRTAIQRLSDIDLVEIAPYQYTRVSLIDYSCAKQMIFMRIVMESRILSDFIDKADEFLIEDLDHIIRKQDILLKGSFVAEDFYKLDTAFHSTFFRVMDALEIWRLMQESVHYTRLRMLDIVEVRDFLTIVEEHKEILNMVREKRKDGISTLLSAHLNGGLIRIKERSGGRYEKYFRNYKEGEI